MQHRFACKVTFDEALRDAHLFVEQHETGALVRQG
jgi:hypothetical protein